jgi:tripartite-type tricarboxylate transporter receptor subunit TctC
MFRIAVLRTLAVLATLAAPLSLAWADDYPSRSIALVVPFAAGGPTDTLARILAERMTRTLGQTVMVDNVTGAGGTIANAKVIKSAADGYTAIIGHLGTHVLAPAVQGLSVDDLQDFQPVAVVATNPQVILSRLDVPATNLQELVAWVKANPGKVSYASGGAGTPSHIMAADFSQRVAPLNIIHYRGAAPAMLDVVAGHVDISFDQAATGLNFARSGKVRAYAVTSATRVPSAPDIPTVDEAGLRASTCRCGMASGCRAERRPTSWRNSTPRCARRSPIPRCASASRTWARRSRRPGSRHPPGSPRSTSRRRRSGCRSSRRRTSARTEIRAFQMPNGLARSRDCCSPRAHTDWFRQCEGLLAVRRTSGDDP